MSLSKTLLVVIICLLFNVASFAHNVIIVESQSYHTAHIMDQEWLNIANLNGDDAAIHPQSVLNNPTTLAQVDALIVSSAVIELDADKINNILTFIQNGGNVYLQTEFLASLDGNIAFEQIATDLGVDFSWGGEIPGYVTPITLANSLATYSDTPEQFNFWFYAGVGSGDENVEIIAEHHGEGVGFSIQSPINGQGKLVTFSDQDWIRQMVNIDALDYAYQSLFASPPFVAPDLVIQTTNMAQCPGDIVSFTAMIDDVPNPFVLSWFINGVILPGVNSTSFSTSPAAGDVISASVAFTKPSGLPCIVESNEIIIASFNTTPVPTLTMAVNTTDLCGNEIAFFNSTLDNSTDLSNFSYTWFVDGNIASITPAQTASIGNFQDGQVITSQLTYDTPCETGLTVTSNPITMNVTTPATPTVEITGNTTICSGEQVVLTASGDHWGTNPTFEWLINGSISGQTSDIFSSNTLTDGQVISLTVTSSVDCVTSSNASSNNADITISAVLNPTLSISASAQVCPGENITYTATGNEWSNNAILEWFIDGVATGNNTNTLSANDFSQGQMITAELSNLSACSNVSSLTSNELAVSFAAPIVPTLDVTTTPTGCEGEIITFTASGTNWDPNAQMQWYVDGVATGNFTDNFSGGSFTAGQIINFELSNLSACYSSSSIISDGVIIEFLPQITPTLSIASTTQGCPGENITYTATGNDWDPNADMEWYVDGIPAFNNSDSFTASNLNEGQIISFELLNMSSCYTSVTLTSNELMVEFAQSITPTIEISASQLVCPNETITYTATGNNWDPNADMEWFVDGIPTGNNTTEMATASFVAGQIITFELSNLSACYSVSSLTSDELIVEFLPSIVPTIEVAASQMVCPGENITYTATGNDWDPNADLEWFVDGTPTGNNTTELSATNFVEGQIITFGLNNLSSCYSVSSLMSADLLVEFLPTFLPTIEISASEPGCPGEEITFNAIGTDWESTTTLEWFVDGVATGITGDEFSSNNLVADQEVTCVLNNLSSCAAQPTVESNLLAVSFSAPILPTIEITTNTISICENEIATLSASGDNWGNNFTLNWFVDGQMIVSGNVDFEVNVQNENQIITAEVISGLDCADGTAVASNAISFEFIEPSQPVVTVSVDAFNCQTNDYTLVADGVYLGTNPTFDWFVDDINVNNTGATLTSVLMPGQTVSVVVATQNECTDVVANSNLLVIEETELQSVIVEQGDALCQGVNGFARLETNGGQAPYTYLWSDNDTNEFRTAIEAGMYQVTITDVNGCTTQVEVEIEEQVGPQIQDIEVTDVNCTEIFGSAIVFVESQNDVVINWKNEDNQVISTEEIVSNLIVGKYTVEISDGNGCFDVREFEVRKMTAPEVVVQDKFEITTGESVDLDPQFSQTQTGMTYEWSPAVGLSCTDCEKPVASPFFTTIYTLKVTTADGCTNSVQTTIYVARTSNVYVPNIFSPNGDGSNDHLVIFAGDEVLQINSMMVFNRQGETIFSNKDFQPNDAQEGWDGTFRGKEAQTGVYVYFAEIEFIDGRIEIFKGDVSIVNSK